MRTWRKILNRNADVLLLDEALPDHQTVLYCQDRMFEGKPSGVLFDIQYEGIADWEAIIHCEASLRMFPIDMVFLSVDAVVNYFYASDSFR